MSSTDDTDAVTENRQVMIALTIGAGQRAGLQGSASYAGAPEAGRVMGGSGIARVEASNDERVAVGSAVVAATGWQDWSVHDAKAVSPASDGGGTVGTTIVHVADGAVAT